MINRFNIILRINKYIVCMMYSILRFPFVSFIFVIILWYIYIYAPIRIILLLLFVHICFVANFFLRFSPINPHFAIGFRYSSQIYFTYQYRMPYIERQYQPQRAIVNGLRACSNSGSQLFLHSNKIYYGPGYHPYAHAFTHADWKNV